MISIIAAVAKNGVIGGGNSLLWHITEDLKRFKAITTGHPVVMGRKTFESIGRPLPGRDNFVLSRSADFQACGVTTVRSLEEVLEQYPAGQEIFIIGGGEIYRQAIDKADRLYLTIIDANFEGDTVFPGVDASRWRETSREFHERGVAFEHPFAFVDYQRI